MPMETYPVRRREMDFMRKASLYIRLLGMLLCLIGLSSMRLVWGQKPPEVTISKPCVQVASSSSASGGGQTCKGDPTTFRDAKPGVKSWKWEFDASIGASSPNSTSTTSYSVVQYGYDSPNQKTVVLTRTFSDTATPPESVTFTVTIGTAPGEFQNWVTADTICNGEILTLDPYPNSSPQGVTYEWSPKGETTQTLSVSEAGCYSVEATTNLGCSIENKIQVVVCPSQSAAPATKWYFGNNAGLDFMGGAPTPIDNSKLNTVEGSASVSDKKGDLIFYTDGIKIYDKDGNVMGILQLDANGKPLLDPVTSKPIVSTAASASTSLGGSQISTQSALIVPKSTCRGCAYQYYVYTTAEINGTRQLTYSIIDMRKNDGKGAIVEVNLPVVGSSTTALSTERTAGVQNKTDSTNWVITRDYGSNIFRITHITKSSVPTQTTVAAGASQTATVEGEGYLKIGPAPVSSTASSGSSTSGTSGTATNPASNTAERPVAMIVPGIPPSPGNPGTNNKVELFTFNTDTGKLEFKRAIDLGPSPPKAYGVEFAPDGLSLYVSLIGDPASASTASSYILRYNLSITDPEQLSLARTEVATSTTQQFGALQIGPDGRIYVAIPGQASLGVIENPDAGLNDRLLEQLIFTFNGQPLGGKTGQLGLPNTNADDSQDGGGGFSSKDYCLGNPTKFSMSPYCPGLIEEYTVNFGDGTAPYSGTATQTSHTYAVAKPYSATLTVQIFRKNKDGSKGASCTVITAVDNLTIASYPQSITLNDEFVCRVPLSTTLSIDIVAQNYAWVFAGRLVSREKTLSVTRGGTYSAFAFNESPECFKGDDALVQFRQPFSPFTPSPPATVCQGSSTTIGFAAIAPAYNTFQWSSGQNTKVVSVSQAGTYSVTATHPNPSDASKVCTSTGIISVSARPNPTLRVATVDPVSCTSLDGQLTATPGSSGTFTYAWTGNNAPLPTTTNALSGVGEGNYAVRVTDEFSCSATQSVTLKSPVNNLVISAFPRDQFCSIPGSGTVNLTLSGGRLPIQYNWRDATNALISSASVLTGINSGTYAAAVSDANGCTAVTPSFRVGLNPTGFANLGPPQDKCAGNALVLRPVSSTVAGNVYQWSNGQNTPTISVTGAGSYTVRVSNPNGCTGAASVQINDRPAPVVTLIPEYRLCTPQGLSTTLTAGGPSSLSFVWLRGNEVGRTLTVSAVGPYSVRATDPAGCTVVASTRVVDFCTPRVFIPEAFTPNGDGRNDFLDVYSTYTSGFELKIFNRWGEVVFVSHEPENIKWDGSYRGEVYPPMMYAYVISYGSQYDPLMPRVVQRGSVLLIR